MKQCIFCGGTGKSREHISSVWTHGIVPVDEGVFFNTKGEQKVELATSKTEHRISTQKTVPIDLAHLQVHGTCGKCNSGWMSDLEVDVKRSLEPILGGQSRAISVDEQLILARWITLKSIVIELLDRERAVVSETARRWFYDNQNPFPTSQIIISNYTGEASRRLFTSRSYFAEGGLVSEPSAMGLFTLIKLGPLLRVASVLRTDFLMS